MGNERRKHTGSDFHAHIFTKKVNTWVIKAPITWLFNSWKKQLLEALVP